jgi:hypothetical protein
LGIIDFNGFFEKVKKPNPRAVVERGGWRGLKKEKILNRAPSAAFFGNSFCRFWLDELSARLK